MKRFRLPSPAMLVAVAAVVLALTGSAFAAKKLGLSVLKDGAKNKTVGVGKLTYVSTTFTVPVPVDIDVSHPVSANCPSGLRPIGGGIKKNTPDDDLEVDDSYPTATGWAGSLDNTTGVEHTVQVVVACANSRAVTGTPPTS
jgi:hypothetical protein